MIKKKVTVIAIENNSSDAIGLSFAVSMFVVSLTLSLYLFSTTGDTIQQTYEMNSRSDNNIYSTLKVPSDYVVSGAEVRQSLYTMKEIGVDIEVNGVIYSKSLDPTTLNVSVIDLNKKYSPTYVRDNKGVLTMLRFK
ncbi:hypothetical protein [Paenibacillus macquariensis]|uniref:hypothetical protein n=1 Tax=Paenibacillus macquariensis TaxID=948756 RepID=UPI0007C2C791|nr:hypothetical protein [Paenibacillus macquariensis]MEC0090904.1 hypothetical protein [Paenibacillus macquariensis]OAB34633.1 hypothetical protein PMSM_12335 [Paenibacillus macquariensis subsp. macquariensis]